MGVFSLYSIKKPFSGDEMPTYDSFFWEVPVDPTILDSLSIESALTREPDDCDEEEKKRINKLKQEVMEEIKIIVKTRLTPMQKEVVDLYFYKGKNQHEVASILNISQQVVSKHLFGANRNGKKIGGAINRLKKLCKELGIGPEKWV